MDATWVIGLGVLMLVSSVGTLFLVVRLILGIKEANKRSLSFLLNIVLIIIVSYPARVWVTGVIAKNNEKDSYANVQNLDYEVEQIDDNEFNIYFFDENGMYYNAKIQEHNTEYEIDAYLLESGTERRSGIEINLGTGRVSKVYMTDYKGNRILVWDYLDYFVIEK